MAGSSDAGSGDVQPAHDGGGRGSVLEVLGVATRLGVTSFGGPIAHIGYFHAEYVARRRWLSEAGFADLVALTQFLPGPASSQLGIAIGTLRAGLLGGIAAWLGFTLPSALALTLFGLALGTFPIDPNAGWLRGLLIAALAVVAQAVWTMARSLAPDRSRGSLAIAAAGVSLVAPTPWIQFVIIVVAGLIGWRLLVPVLVPDDVDAASGVPRWVGVACLVLFALLLVGLPLLRLVTDSQLIALVEVYYRAGALVFGGGHVVLPLLEAEVVPGWMTAETFLAGYGAAQAVPGPLFTFAAYLGAVATPPPNGWSGASLAVVAIFLPAFLLTWGALPWWGLLRRQPGARSALMGINAAVVGILAGALYTPVFTSAVTRPADLAIALVAFGALALWKLPPWLVVAGCATAGLVVGLIAPW